MMSTWLTFHLNPWRTTSSTTTVISNLPSALKRACWTYSRKSPYASPTDTWVHMAGFAIMMMIQGQLLNKKSSAVTIKQFLTSKLKKPWRCRQENLSAHERPPRYHTCRPWAVVVARQKEETGDSAQPLKLRIGGIVTWLVLFTRWRELLSLIFSIKNSSAVAIRQFWLSRLKLLRLRSRSWAHERSWYLPSVDRCCRFAKLWLHCDSSLALEFPDGR